MPRPGRLPHESGSTEVGESPIEGGDVKIVMLDPSMGVGVDSGDTTGTSPPRDPASPPPESAREKVDNRSTPPPLGDPLEPPIRSVRPPATV